MLDELAVSIKNKNVILFVGAGVPRNIGLPSHSELIDKMVKDLGYEPTEFNQLGNGNYLELAEYYYLEKGSLRSLRSWMDQLWDTKDVDIGQSEIYKHIIDLDIPLIYTTNYDRWLECAFDYYKKKYIKITNVADIVKARNNEPQIVKFHGDLDDDASIVLTESSFFHRLDFETPLDIKLRSDALGKSILFIGYSLTDINIRFMLFKLQQQWKLSNCENMRPKSYIFLTKSNMVRERILEERGITPIVSEIDDPGEALNVFLKNLKEQVLRS
ncbi:SIR2 family protein [Fictibacillus sp. Mic-4]|uniref:SIR2 family protein n=1 Tax=Fictibacillus TaxID=1329200 RepID=UPI00040B9D4C|nr:SIR2 family protein [Fictibacillus gelatini]